MRENSILRMVYNSDIVYVDGMTIKDRYQNPTHPDIEKVMNNINNYYISYFNRNPKNGTRCLVLHSDLENMPQ
ncbi:MAG: hypothetical protein ACOC22_04375 [bacterium]